MIAKPLAGGFRGAFAFRLRNTAGRPGAIKMRILEIAALGIGLASWEVPQAHAATDQDFDLACAVVSAAEVATTALGSAERNTTFQTSALRTSSRRFSIRRSCSISVLTLT